MSYYRLLFMKADEGTIMGVEEIAARDDVDAVRVAKSRLCDTALEVWCDKRKVKRFNPVVEANATFAF